VLSLRVLADRGFSAVVIWKCGQHQLSLGAGDPGVIVGILNVTPDSFSDGGSYIDAAAAVAHAMAMIEMGAGIIDIGGESTRPGAQAVTVNEESDRVLPVVEALHALKPDCLISIDTSKASVAHAACEAGASIINDVTALRADPEMASVAATCGAGLVLMHMQGNPRTMQHLPQYEDVVAEILEFLAGQQELALAEGVDEETIALDPGIGFGKSEEHNWEILRRIEEFAILERPLLLGVSRKKFLGTLLDLPQARERAGASAALTGLMRTRGVRLHRVHDVRENADALRVAERLI
jgi:dihydropteroate synthase